MVVYVGDITVKLGAALDGAENAEFHAEKIAWKDVPEDNVRPVTVINTVPPVGFHQLHKWVKGEIHAKSEALAAIHANGADPKDYLPPGAKFVPCPAMSVTMEGHDASAPVITFVGLSTAGVANTGVTFTSEEFTHNHDGEAITIFRFVCVSASLAAA